MLLSIDVGIKNLAMCMIDATTKKIEQWDVDGVPTESSDGLYRTLANHLNRREWLLNSTTILIEKQPDRNKKMKSVENFLNAYFIIKCPDAEVIIYDARHKIPDVVGSGKTQYRKRKRVSIERCKEFINSDEVNKDWIKIFDKSKKKDDLADTVMQALSFINRRVPLPSQSARARSVVKPRKPTENQKETKYSKSNLVWFVKNSKNTQDLLKDKRFVKDLKRYYSSLEELVKAMTP